MKPTSCALVLLLLFSFCFSINAQNKALKNANVINVNLTGIAFKNYSFQYQRILTRKISVALSYRTMPESSVPFKNFILDAADNDPDTKEVLDILRISNTAITPELRIYLSKKGFGRGFYIAPFYRYAAFKTNNMKFSYTNSLGGKSDIFLSGKLTSNTAGLLFGTQWAIGKHLCLDFWIFGPHYGSGNGLFSGTTISPMNPIEQANLKNELESFDLPLTKETSTVTANGATLKLDGPWAGIRSGLSFGVKF